MEQSANTFSLIGSELKRRIFRPLPSFTFWSFLFRGFVGFGGLAIWIEVLKLLVADHTTSEGVRLALLTYYPAVGCAASLQIAVYEETRAYLREFGNTASFLLISACAISFYLESKYPIGVLVVGILLSCFSVLLAWIAIGLDKPFDEPDPDVAVGGNTSVPLAGNSEGFDL